MSHTSLEFLTDLPAAPQGLPQDLATMTDEQDAACVTWFSKLTIADLRSRQSICSQEIAIAFKMREAGQPREMSERNLRVKEDQLMRAIMLKTFGEACPRATIV